MIPLLMEGGPGQEFSALVHISIPRGTAKCWCPGPLQVSLDAGVM